MDKEIYGLVLKSLLNQLEPPGSSSAPPRVRDDEHMKHLIREVIEEKNQSAAQTAVLHRVIDLMERETVSKSQEKHQQEVANVTETFQKLMKRPNEEKTATVPDKTKLSNEQKQSMKELLAKKSLVEEPFAYVTNPTRKVNVNDNQTHGPFHHQGEFNKPQYQKGKTSINEKLMNNGSVPKPSRGHDRGRSSNHGHPNGNPGHPQGGLGNHGAPGLMSLLGAGPSRQFPYQNQPFPGQGPYQNNFSHPGPNMGYQNSGQGTGLIRLINNNQGQGYRGRGNYQNRGAGYQNFLDQGTANFQDQGPGNFSIHGRGNFNNRGRGNHQNQGFHQNRGKGNNETFVPLASQESMDNPHSGSTQDLRDRPRAKSRGQRGSRSVSVGPAQRGRAAQRAQIVEEQTHTHRSQGAYPKQGHANASAQAQAQPKVYKQQRKQRSRREYEDSTEGVQTDSESSSTESTANKRYPSVTTTDIDGDGGSDSSCAVVPGVVVKKRNKNNKKKKKAASQTNLLVDVDGPPGNAQDGAADFVNQTTNKNACSNNDAAKVDKAKLDVKEKLNITQKLNVKEKLDTAVVDDTPLQLFLGSGFNEKVASSMDVLTEVKDVMLIAKANGAIITCTPKTLGELRAFKEKHPKAEVIVVKS